MPGTIRIGNEGLRTNIETDSQGNLYISTPEDQTTINFVSASVNDVSASHNRIRFIQDTTTSGEARAFVHISASSAGKCGYNIDTPEYDRLIRANRDMIVGSSAEIFNIGLIDESENAYKGWGINNSIALSGNRDAYRFFIQDRQHGDKIYMSGSLEISGSGPHTIHNNVEVGGVLSATRKSFVIQHQELENHNLVHGSLEGPENGVYIRGKISDDNKIALPGYWEWLVDEDSISVHITPIGYHILPLYFKEIKDNYVYVNKKTNFYYYICAERKDVEKLKIIEKK
tara:strand:+ start:297 stop:1154 length:858 start_codon:yes stop_codon:yes gene_type:complete